VDVPDLEAVIATFWRISNHLELNGRGGLIASGRWHSMGQPIVYLGESPAGVLLEHLVHLTSRNGKLPASYNLLEIKASESLAITSIEPSGTTDWQNSLAVTQQLGDAWLAGLETPLARVPSVILPSTWNLLLNPRHEEAMEIEVVSAGEYRFDQRLFRFGSR
jgi:RES domain-containing protein